MRIDSPLMTNSNASGSFTGSFYGDGSGLTGLTTASYIEFTNVDGLSSFSSSIQSRVTDLESFSSSLDLTYATDADLNLVSSSVDSLNAATSSYALAANISGSFTSLSQSVASDITDIIDGTQIVTSASYALTASYSDGFTASSIASTNISTEYIDFNLTPTAVPVEGRLVWNADEGTVDLGLDGATLQLGQEQYWYVRNNTAQEISNGTAVYASGTLGASGRITVAPFIADGSIPAKFFLGIATTNIPVGADGYVTTFGKVRSFDTSTFDSGSVLYVSPTSAGSLTPTEPTAPNLKLPVAFSINSKNNGTIAVRMTQGVRLDNGHDVDINSASDGDLLVRSASVWINTKDLTGPYNIDGAVTASVFTGIFEGAVSQSAQIASDISGSLGANATLIRSLTASGISGSLGTNATLIRSLTAAGISGSLGVNATLIRSLTAASISGSFTSLSQSVASDINEKLNIADTGSFAKTNVDNIFSGEQTFTNITVNGTGSFAYITSVTGSSKIIGDAFVVVNNDTPSQRYAGLAVYDSGSAGTTGSLFFDGQLNDWNYEYTTGGGTDYGTVIFGPEYSTKGSPTYPANNTLQKGSGTHHLADSNITDDGTTVKIGSNTQITGSLGVTGNINGNASTATTASYASTGPFLIISNNLSDLANAATARTNLGVDAAGTDNSTNVTLAGAYDYITISGQEITRNQIDLGTDVTSTLPIANGGTGATTAAGARTNLGVDAAGTDNSTNVTLNTTAHNYLSITGQEITLGAIDISDDTNLTAGTGLTLTGDTIAIDSSVLTTADEGSGNGLDADLWDGNQFSSYLNQAVLSTSSPTFANIYIGDYIYHSGDTDTYMQFNAANSWRVVAGGTDRLSVAGDVNINNATDLQINGTSRRVNFNAGTGTIRTTTANALYLETNSTSAIAIDGSQKVGVGTTTPQKNLEVLSPANDFISVGVNQISVGQWTGIHFGYRENNNSYRKSAIVFERTDLTASDAQGKIHILNGPQGSSGNATLSHASLTVAENRNVGIGETSPTAKLEVYNSGSTVFSVNGSQGQLFSVEDDLTGTIFTVADISGVPILEVEDTGVVTIDDTLQVYGDITAYYSSDERLKDNITLIENANEKVMQLRGVEFDWNEKSKHEGHDVGVIAQDVEKVLPELVQDRKNGYKGVDYQKIVALLIESNKELIKQNQDLTSRLERLESKLD